MWHQQWGLNMADARTTGHCSLVQMNFVTHCQRRVWMHLPLFSVEFNKPRTKKEHSNVDVHFPSFSLSRSENAERARIDFHIKQRSVFLCVNLDCELKRFAPAGQSVRWAFLDLTVNFDVDAHGRRRMGNHSIDVMNTSTKERLLLSHLRDDLSTVDGEHICPARERDDAESCHSSSLDVILFLFFLLSARPLLTSND